MISHENISLADFIFKRIAGYVLVPMLLLCIGIAYFIYDTTLDDIFTPINMQLSDMQRISDKILGTLDSSRRQLIEMMSNTSKPSNPHRLHDILYGIISAQPYISGAGYALPHEYGNFGEYMLQIGKEKITTSSMVAVYAKRHTDYSHRPWFQRAIASKKPIIVRSSPNIFGQPVSLITYAFPIIQDGKIRFVCVLDVPISRFGEPIGKLKELSKFSSAVTIYYVSTPSDKPSDPLFFNIVDDVSTLNSPSTTTNLKKIFLDRKSNTWVFSGHYLYKKVSYLGSGATFIIQLNLIGTLILTILWLAITLTMLYFIAWSLRKKLVTKLSLITRPIATLSANANDLARLHLETFHQRRPPLTHIAEIDLLICSLETMYYNLNILIAKEKQLEKTQGELALAARIQHKFIKPYYFKTIEQQHFNLQIEAKLQTANILSGDIYDCVAQENEFYCLIGDATGKDVTAAIFSTFMLTGFRSLCYQQLAPHLILNRLDNYLCTMDAEDMFISCICLKVDYIKNKLEFAVAGHDYPIIHNHCNQIINYPRAEPDIVLGVLPDYQYNHYTLPLPQCKNICLFTDGISEALDSENQSLGVERLIQMINYYLANNTTENSLCQTILQTCQQRESAKSKDDKTVIAISLCPS